jgi:hypothetical protein
MTRESQGFVYMAKRPCGKVSAMAWDDTGHEKSTAKSIERWIRRGDKVERVEVFKGDQFPETICRPECDECTSPNAQVQGLAGSLANPARTES